MDPLNRLVARNPANYQLTGHILMDSYHPLPWLLGDYPNIGYYDNDTKPPEMDADFLMVDEARIDDVENALHDSYFTRMLTLRDAQDPSKLYLRVKKFQSLFPGRKPDFVPRKSPRRWPSPAQIGGARHSEMKAATALLLAVCLATVCATLPLAALGRAAHCADRLAGPGCRRGRRGALLAYERSRQDGRSRWAGRNGRRPACLPSFGLRAFCWLVFVNGDSIYVLSPNNLGDLPLHLTYIRYFAKGAEVLAAESDL